LVEHENIYCLIERIQKDKAIARLLKALADTLDGLIRFEERTLFNHLQQHLSADELKRLEDGYSKKEGDIDYQRHDQFWIKYKQS